MIMFIIMNSNIWPNTIGKTSGKEFLFYEKNELSKRNWRLHVLPESVFSPEFSKKGYFIFDCDNLTAVIENTVRQSDSVSTQVRGFVFKEKDDHLF